MHRLKFKLNARRGLVLQLIIRLSFPKRKCKKIFKTTTLKVIYAVKTVFNIS